MQSESSFVFTKDHHSSLSLATEKKRISCRPFHLISILIYFFHLLLLSHEVRPSGLPTNILRAFLCTVPTSCSDNIIIRCMKSQKSAHLSAIHLYLVILILGALCSFAHMILTVTSDSLCSHFFLFVRSKYSLGTHSQTSSCGL